MLNSEVIVARSDVADGYTVRTKQTRAGAQLSWSLFPSQNCVPSEGDRDFPHPIPLLRPQRTDLSLVQPMTVRQPYNTTEPV